MRIAIAGTGYVGLSLAVLLAQHNEVTEFEYYSKEVKNEWQIKYSQEYGNQLLMNILKSVSQK